MKKIMTFTARLDSKLNKVNQDKVANLIVSTYDVLESISFAFYELLANIFAVLGYAVYFACALAVTGMQFTHDVLRFKTDKAKKPTVKIAERFKAKFSDANRRDLGKLMMAVFNMLSKVTKTICNLMFNIAVIVIHASFYMGAVIVTTVQFAGESIRKHREELESCAQMNQTEV